MLELILYLILGGFILAILLFAIIGVAVVIEFYKSCRNDLNKDVCCWCEKNKLDGTSWLCKNCIDDYNKEKNKDLNETL